MPLAPGTRLGAYEILSPLGAGGMGEVYRARDTRLNRDVAIKVLPDEVAADRERLARFEREAQVLAQLNHPHIAHIHGFEDSTGTPALIMELVDGPTLENRIAKGPLSIDEALAIAMQIAEALEAAHDQGIIHRDLKPSNVKVRDDGTVKVLDFGLAKALEPAKAPIHVDATQSPTLATPLVTGIGLVLGTAAYMSPEQARGTPVDKRSDIWAFGCLLYEMLTGGPPFPAKTIADTLALVLTREPDLDALRADTPPAIRRLLARCFVKDPKHRLRDIGDARLEIETARTEKGDRRGFGVAGRQGRQVWRWVGVAVAAAIASVVASSIVVSRNTSTPRPTSVARLVVTPPQGEPVAIETPAIAISPNGRRIVYVAGRGSRQHLYVHDIDQFASTPLDGTDGASSPFFSPDGQWVGFVANGRLRKVTPYGGPPQTIAETTQTINAFAVGSWESDDTIFFTPTVGVGVWRMTATGGGPKPITTLLATENSHRWPQLLPGGKTLLFTSVSAAESQIFAQSLQTGERRPLVNGVAGSYLPSGHLVFVQAGTLMAAPFDVAQLKMTGPPVAVLTGVMQVMRLRSGQTTNLVPQVSFSTAGTMAYVPASPHPHQSTLVWVNRDGVEQPTGASGGAYYQPRVAPDGKRVAITVGGEDHDDVWLYDIGRQTWSRVTSAGNSGFPLWTRDGRRLVYVSDRAGRENIYSKTLDGSAGEERLLASERSTFPFSWAADGTLAFVLVHPQTLQDIWMLPPAGTGSPRPFLETPFGEGAPAFSPDGRWVAYVSNESGRNEIYVRPYPGPGEKLTISTEGGSEPIWSRTGRELFYRNGDAMMSVGISAGPPLEVGSPRRLFERPYESTLALWPDYDVTPDGQRFLMVRTLEQHESPPQINVVVNWFSELQQRVPSR